MESTKNIRLYFRSILHAIFCVHHFTVNVYALPMIISVIDNENVVLRHLCTLCFAYGTNWNFVSIILFNGDCDSATELRNTVGRWGAEDRTLRRLSPFILEKH